MTYEEAYAIKTSAWYKNVARYTADDGTVFTIGQIADVASRNIAIVIFKQPNITYVLSDTLYANPDFAAKEAERMCMSYNEKLQKERK